MEDCKSSMKWAENYIDEFIKNDEFNPYDLLVGTESQEQKLYGLCIEYMENIKTLTENFRSTRDKIVFHME